MSDAAFLNRLMEDPRGSLVLGAPERNVDEEEEDDTSRVRQTYFLVELWIHSSRLNTMIFTMSF